MADACSDESNVDAGGKGEVGRERDMQSLGAHSAHAIWRDRHA